MPTKFREGSSIAIFVHTIYDCASFYLMCQYSTLFLCSIRPVYGAQHPPLTEPLGSPPRSAGPKSKRQQEQQTFDNFNFQTADVWADTPEEDFTTLSLDSALNQKEKVEDKGASVKLGQCRVIKGLKLVHD